MNVEFVIKAYSTGARTEERIVDTKSVYGDAVKAAQNWSKSGDIVGVYANGRVHMVSYRAGKQHLLHPDLDVKGDPDKILAKFLRDNEPFLLSDEEKVEKWFNEHERLPSRESIAEHLLAGWQRFSTKPVPTLVNAANGVGRPSDGVVFKSNLEPRTKKEAIAEVKGLLASGEFYKVPMLHKDGTLFVTNGTSIKSIPVTGFGKDGWYDVTGTPVVPDREYDLLQVVGRVSENRVFLATVSGLVSMARAAEKLRLNVGLIVRDGSAWIGTVRLKNKHVSQLTYVFIGDPVRIDSTGSVKPDMTASAVFSGDLILHHLKSYPTNALLRVGEEPYSTRAEFQGGKLVIEASSGAKSTIMPLRGYVEHTKPLPVDQPSPKSQPKPGTPEASRRAPDEVTDLMQKLKETIAEIEALPGGSPAQRSAMLMRENLSSLRFLQREGITGVPKRLKTAANQEISTAKSLIKVILSKSQRVNKYDMPEELRSELMVLEVDPHEQDHGPGDRPDQDAFAASLRSGVWTKPAVKYALSQSGAVHNTRDVLRSDLIEYQQTLGNRGKPPKPPKPGVDPEGDEKRLVLKQLADFEKWLKSLK